MRKYTSNKSRVDKEGIPEMEQEGYIYIMRRRGNGKNKLTYVNLKS